MLVEHPTCPVIAAWFTVVSTGRWPWVLRDRPVQLSNYCARVWLYATMVHAEYPEFRNSWPPRDLNQRDVRTT